MSTCKDRLLYKDEFGDIHTVDKINGKRIGDKAVKSKLFDYEQEEADGKLIHLPCKVGDTVYSFCDTFGVVLPYFVETLNISYYEKNLNYYSYEANCTNVEENELLDSIDFDIEDIGKTVFLTKEETEKALVERSTTE